uniref:Bm8248 n=1 Tax=Brugia malayi TaxID=6279 RepID=A0A1I9G8C5_BRUMA|nr:Bm8248 [Brugia malayi]
MEAYEGPIDSTYRIPDVESEPIEHLVTVYHSGRSDEFVPSEEKKPTVDVGEVFTDAAQALGAKITGLFKRGPAHLDYPTSGPYDGPLASTSLASDVEGEPLQQYVSVYHSGRSDELLTPTQITEVPVEEKPIVAAKIITGLFKKGDTYLDYPVMEAYEGPIDSTYRIPDVESEPIEHLVTVYHSGRSDEFVPSEEKKPTVDVGEVFTDAAQALGAKITGLFKRGPAHLDYPTSGPYDGPLASTSLASDVEGEPLQQYVSVYHSGRSDELLTPTQITEVPVEEKPIVAAKIITGLFKKGDTYLDYPVMEAYEGPIDSTYRIPDVESEPIEHLVTVYHSGRSDEFVPSEEKKPTVDVGEVFTDAAQALGAKITGLFKRGPAHLDYPTSGPYDGPLASTSLASDVEGEPLQQYVSVYHSGRSDELLTPTQITEVPVEEKPIVAAKIITGLFKKGDTYLDYPVMEAYEGPIDSTYRIPDVESEPIEHLVTVYHSGRSDEFVPSEEKKPTVDVGEVFTDAAQALGAKITGLFKRGPAHLDYPTSGPYDGPLASTSLASDVEGEPLQQYVSVYHSGRSDEPVTKIVEIPTEIPVEEMPMEEKPILLPR